MKNSKYKNKLIIIAGIILVLGGLFFRINPQQLTGSTTLKSNFNQFKVNKNTETYSSSINRKAASCRGYWTQALEFVTEVDLNESESSEIFSKINTYVKNGCDIKFNLVGRLDNRNQKEIFDSVRSLTCENNVISDSQVAPGVMCEITDRRAFNGAATLQFALIEDQIIRFAEKATGYNEDVNVLSTSRQRVPSPDQNARYIYQMFVK